MSDQNSGQPPQDPNQNQPAAGPPPEQQPPAAPPPVPPMPPMPPAQYPSQQPAQPYGQSYGGMPPVAGPPAGTYGYQPGYGGGPAQAVPDTSTNAIVAFVLAICSWLVCPIVLAIVALVFASNAKKEIAASNGWKTGSGFVTAAKWIAWINLIVVPVFIVIYIVFIVLIIGASSTYNPAGNNTFNEFSTPGAILLSLVG